MNKKINESQVSDKQVFTTGEAAKICSVSQQTIIRCFDSGRLQGFKVPGSRFRRIPRGELIRFMQQNNMDLAQIGSSTLQVLVVGLSPAETDAVIWGHATGHRVQIHHADDALGAGFLAHKCNPKLILMGSDILGMQEQAVRRLLTDENGTEPMIVIVKNKYNNGLNVGHQNDESTEVIKKAVLQLLSA